MTEWRCTIKRYDAREGDLAMVVNYNVETGWRWAVREVYGDGHMRLVATDDKHMAHQLRFEVDA